MACWSNVSLLPLLLSLMMIPFSRATAMRRSFCGVMDELDYDDSDCSCNEHFNHSSHSSLGGMLTCSNTNPTFSSQRGTPTTTRAVIHMGIHKTGSSSIQYLSRKFNTQLRQDGYDLPWRVYLDHFSASAAKKIHMYRENQVQFSSCFLSRENPERLQFPCIPELILSGLDIAKRKKNIFVSSESFSTISSEGLENLSVYLSPWDDVTIVIYYRRYYDWLISFYNERLKIRKLEDSNMWKKSIVDYAISKSTEVTYRYTSKLLERVKEYFDNVILMNFHEKNKDLSKAFYCDAMPNVHQTCTAVRKEKKTPRENGRTQLIYHNLAYGAQQRGLVSIKSQGDLIRVATSSKHYHEKEMNQTKRDFKMKCPTPESKEKLLKISLELEQELFPEIFDSPLGEADLRSDFESKVKYELCELDIEETLKEEKWEYFFKIRGASMVWNKARL